MPCPTVSLANEIWFVLGMSVCVFDLQLKGKKRQGTIIGILFLGLSVAVYRADIQNSDVSFVLGLIACVAVILMVANFEGKSGKAVELPCKIHNADFPDAHAVLQHQ